MLKSIRANRNKFLGIFVAGVCAFLMVGFGLNSFFAPQHLGAIASINDEEITYNEFLKRYDQIRRHFQEQFGANFHLIEPQLNIRQQAVDSLISDKLMEDFAKRLGLTASTAQIEAQLLSNPFFQGQYSQRAYKEYLRAVGMTGGQLERAMRKEIVSSQISGLFADSVLPTEKELVSIYNDQNAKVTLDYLEFDPAAYRGEVDTTNNEAIEEFFASSSNRYVTPRKVEFSFLAFKPADFLNEVQIADDELQDLLRLNEEEFSHPRRVRLKQIFFSTGSSKQPESAIPFLQSEPAAEAEMQQQTADELVRARAESALERLEAGEKFEDLARELSEDSAAKTSGGDLGYQTFDQLAPEIRRTAEALDVGEHSRVIKTARGYHIVLVEDYEPEKPMTFEEARPKLEQKLRKQDAPLYAFEAAQEMFERWDESSKPLGEFAAEKSLAVVSSPGPVTFGEDAKEIPPQLLREALKLEEGERDVIELGDTTYLLEISKVVESAVPELSAVADRVKEDYVAHRAREKAQKAGEEALAELGAAAGDWEPETASKHATLQEAAAARGLEVSHTKPATAKDSSAEPLLAAPEIRTAAFSLRKEAPIAPQLFEHQGKFYLIALNSRELPDEPPAASELSTLREEAARNGTVRMLESLIATLKSEANIWVNTELLLNES